MWRLQRPLEWLLISVSYSLSLLCSALAGLHKPEQAVQEFSKCPSSSVVKEKAKSEHVNMTATGSQFIHQHAVELSSVIIRTFAAEDGQSEMCQKLE